MTKVSIDRNQCCAIGPDNKRCPNAVSYISHNHCSKHHPIAIKLYKKYF